MSGWGNVWLHWKKPSNDLITKIPEGQGLYKITITNPIGSLHNKRQENTCSIEKRVVISSINTFLLFFFLFPIYLKPVVFRSTEECIRLVYTYMHNSMYIYDNASISIPVVLTGLGFLHNTFTHVQISKSQMLRFASTRIPQSLLFWLISVSIHKIFIQVSLIHLNILVSNVKICKYMISQPSMFWQTSLYISVPPGPRYISQPLMFWPRPVMY